MMGVLLFLGNGVVSGNFNHEAALRYKRLILISDAGYVSGKISKTPQQ